MPEIFTALPARRAFAGVQFESHFDASSRVANEIEPDLHGGFYFANRTMRSNLEAVSAQKKKAASAQAPAKPVLMEDDSEVPGEKQPLPPLMAADPHASLSLRDVTQQIDSLLGQPLDASWHEKARSQLQRATVAIKEASEAFTAKNSVGLMGSGEEIPESELDLQPEPEALCGPGESLPVLEYLENIKVWEPRSCM